MERHFVVRTARHWKDNVGESSRHRVQYYFLQYFGFNDRQQMERRLRKAGLLLLTQRSLWYGKALQRSERHAKARLWSWRENDATPAPEPLH